MSKVIAPMKTECFHWRSFVALDVYGAVQMVRFW